MSTAENPFESYEKMLARHRAERDELETEHAYRLSNAREQMRRRHTREMRDHPHRIVHTCGPPDPERFSAAALAAGTVVACTRCRDLFVLDPDGAGPRYRWWVRLPPAVARALDLRLLTEAAMLESGFITASDLFARDDLGLNNGRVADFMVGFG